jgi:hypothetical protein
MIRTLRGINETLENYVLRTWRAEGWDTDLDQAYELIIDTPTTLANYQQGDTAAALTIVSADGADDKDSTGVTYATVYWLDNNYNLVRETIALEGVAAQTLGASAASALCSRVLMVEAAAVGSGGVSAGNITTKIATAASNTIIAGNNRSYGAIFTVPRGHVARINEIGLSVPSAVADYVDFRLRYKDNLNSRGVITLATYGIDANEGENIVSIPGSPDWEFAVGTDIWLEADSNAASKTAGGWIDFTLYQG